MKQEHKEIITYSFAVALVFIACSFLSTALAIIATLSFFVWTFPVLRETIRIIKFRNGETGNGHGSPHH